MWLDHSFKKVWDAILQKIMEDDAEIKQEIEFWEQRQPSQCSLEEFFAEYTWVVYVAGFNAWILHDHWDAIQSALRDFNVMNVAKEPEAVREELLHIIGNHRKADYVIRTALNLASDPETWSRLQAMGPEAALNEVLKFPGIGPKNRYHLLRNLGWDVCNHDGITEMLADCLETDCDTLLRHLSEVSGLRITTTDILLRYWSDLYETYEDCIEKFRALIVLGA